MKRFTFMMLAIIIVLLTYNFSTVSLTAGDSATKDAAVPTGQSVTWGKEPVEEHGSKRAVVCLNGLWKFQPADGPAAAPHQDSGWGWIRVPGSWRRNPVIVNDLTRANGPAWSKFGNDSPAAWYGRDITIPAGWGGRKIVLDIRRVSTGAAVYIDGNETGRVSWPGGEVDITSMVKPGHSYKLTIKVLAIANKEEVTRVMGTGDGQVFKEKFLLATRGLIGDVLLTSRPMGAVLTGCAIRTSVREHRLAIDAEYAGAAKGPVALTALIRDAKGFEVKRFTANTCVSAGDGVLTASWDWSDPQLWDIDHPVMYTLELSAKGSGLDDVLIDRFGFREFRIDGKRFLLNESEVRLRPGGAGDGRTAGTRELIAAALEGLRGAGFNTVIKWGGETEPGIREFDEIWCQEADRLGLLLMYPTPVFPYDSMMEGGWKKAGGKENWEKLITPMLKRLQNHPSVVVWMNGTNCFGHNQDQNPEAIGSKSRGSLQEHEKDFSTDRIDRPLLIGGWPPYRGGIDEFKLYKRALQADEAKVSYERNKANHSDAELNSITQKDNQDSAGVPFAAERDLVVYYPFNEGSGRVVKDASGNGFDTTMNSGKWMKLRSGAAVFLDGENMRNIAVKLPKDKQLGKGSFSVDCWLNPATISNSENRIQILDLSNCHPAPEYVRLELAGNDGTVLLRTGYKRADGGISHDTFKSKGKIPAGVWTHVVVVYDRVACSVKIFLNGELDNEIRFANIPWHRHAAIGEEILSMIRRIDPVRPVMAYAGGPVGDIYTANNYLNLIPLQEREEWLSRWSIDGDMPVLMVEFGTPLFSTFHRGRVSYKRAIASEPLYSEFCAIYQGPDAYRGETAAYRETLFSTYDKEQLWWSWHNIEVARIHEGFNRLEALFNCNTYRTWRTWGITGGMLPWNNGHGWLNEAGGDAKASATGNHWPILINSVTPKIEPLPAFVPGSRGDWRPEATLGLLKYLRPEGTPITIGGQALMANNQETLAWIAGAPQFTDKTHNFRAGEEVSKQLVLINDGRSLRHFKAEWKVRIGGVEFSAGKQEGDLLPATTKFLPIQITMPSTLAAERVSGGIHLECSIGDAKHSDTFPFHVFRLATMKSPDVAIIDPLGETTAFLDTLGVTHIPWNGTDTSRLVIVGRNAFAKGNCDPAPIERCLRAGGRVLLMAQDPDWMRNKLGLRVSRQLTRRGFPVIADHPMLAGLDAEALRDWAGSSRLIPETDTAHPEAAAERMPPYGWHWGNRHAVSSAAIEVPHRAGWRPVIACEFDVSYTPLAEVPVGAGTLTVCTLDLEDHAAADPAAELIARSVLVTAASEKNEPRTPVYYLGGAAGAEILSTSGIINSCVKGLPGNGLVIIGADADLDDASLDAFLRRGGKALFLPRHTETAPLGVRLTKAGKHPGSLAVPAWASCHGIMPGELRRRTDGETWVVSAGADAIGADGLLAEVRRGSGIAVFFQLDTASLDADHLAYNRLTRWRWTRALTQIAANLGAVCEGDDRMVKPISPPDRIPLAGPWKAKLTLRLPAALVTDPRHKDPGISEQALALTARNADEKGLQNVPVPKEWESYGGDWIQADGEAVFRKTIDIPATWAGRDLTLSLGTVDDFDTTYFDGEKIGSTDITMKNFWMFRRKYEIPARLVTPGKHVIAVRVFDHFGSGGMYDDPEHLALTPKWPLTPPPPGMYHPDWRTDFPLGDDPYRYFRW